MKTEQYLTNKIDFAILSFSLATFYQRSFGYTLSDHTSRIIRCKPIATQHASSVPLSFYQVLDRSLRVIICKLMSAKVAGRQAVGVSTVHSQSFGGPSIEVCSTCRIVTAV